jgi:ADP-ribosylation factor-like protein 1
MQLGEVHNSAPTIGFNVEYVKYENINFQVWDIGGQYEIRPYWRCYYPNTNAIIFAIDSSDKERIDIVKQEIFILLEEEELKNVPIAILANKQDKVGCFSEIEITEKLELNKIKNRQWQIFKTCAVEGTGLDDAFKWITNIIRGDE